MGNDERWKGIPGWPYEVSDQGRVRRSESGSSTFAGRMLSLYRVPNGYQSAHLHRDGNSRQFRVHRLVLRAFEGPCPEGHEADHINGDRQDNRLENLRWLKRAENRGSTFTEEQVIEIRERYANGSAPQQELADEYGVHRNTISGVVRGERWGHVGGPIAAPKQESSPKLTEAKVAEMRDLYDRGGVSQSDLSEMFGVSTSQVSRIVRYEDWPDVKPGQAQEVGDGE